MQIDNNLFKPINFINVFIENHPLFKSSQQDVIEFIHFFLNDLSKGNNIGDINLP